MKITWKQGRGMPTFIKGGAMGIVDSVPVYAAGCTYPWRETEQAWYWDAARGDWFPVEPSLPSGRAYTHGGTLKDGLLVLGGRKSGAEGRISLRDAWWLRRRDGTFYWTRLPDMNYPRAIPSIGVAGSKVLAFGGGEWEKSQGGAFATRHLTHYEILDLENLSAGWRDMGPLPFPSLVGSAFASVGESTCVFGGYECWTENNKRQIRQSAAAWRYDFPTDTWTQLADFPGTASGWCAAAYEKSVILLGGGITFKLQGVNVPYQTNHTLEPGTPRQRLIGAYSDLIFVYDTETDVARQGSLRNSGYLDPSPYRMMADRLPIGNNDVRCTISGNTLFVAGGETIDPALSNCSNAFLIGTVE